MAVLVGKVDSYFLLVLKPKTKKKGKIAFIELKKGKKSDIIEPMETKNSMRRFLEPIQEERQERAKKETSESKV